MLYPRMFGMPTLRSIHPFNELNHMRQQMDRLMDTVLNRPGNTAHSGVFPAINVGEDGNFFYIRAELPGVDVKDLDIQTTANNLTIAGERKVAPEGEAARYHRREREGGRFSRAFSLPKDIDTERVEARLANGVLTLKLPKAESAKPKKISIGS